MKLMTMTELRQVKGIGRWRFDIKSDERGKPKNTIPDFLLKRNPRLRLISYVCGTPVSIIFEGTYEDNLIKNINSLRIQIQREITRQCACSQHTKYVIDHTERISIFKTYDDDAEVCVGSFVRSKSFLLFKKK